MPWGLSRRAGRPVFFCLANSALAFPGHSPAFPQRSFWGPRAAREALTISGAGLRPAGILVGVTGFEPAASSSRTGDHSALPCH